MDAVQRAALRAYYESNTQIVALLDALDQAERHIDSLRERVNLLGQRDTGSDCITVPPCAAVVERDDLRAALDRVRELVEPPYETTYGGLDIASKALVRAAIEGEAT